jgi:hypothetical protein
VSERQHREEIMDETKVTAHLPTATVEMVIRDYREKDADVMSISLRATPSLEAFGKALAGPGLGSYGLMWANPLIMWGRMAEMMWRPWLGALTAASQAARHLEKPKQD